MIEMVYQDRLSEPIVLANGKYKGFEYWILNLGTHPTAYVEIPRKHQAWFKDYDELDDLIYAHGGLTYSRNYLSVVNSGEWTIGWDYAHLDDYYYDKHFPMDGKQWTTKEIFHDVKDVINQVVKLCGGD